MKSYPKHILRCQHIKVNGTQCGSPALSRQRFCFFHHANRPRRLRMNSAPKANPALHLPVFEDANSIQVAVMQLTSLLLNRQIDHKTAGLALYALQIASCNLARLSFEPEKPTLVVIDRASVAETPLGQTPWSTKGRGHDSADGDDDEEPKYLAEYLLKSLGLPKEQLEQVRRGEFFEEPDVEKAHTAALQEEETRNRHRLLFKPKPERVSHEPEAKSEKPTASS